MKDPEISPQAHPFRGSVVSHPSRLGGYLCLSCKNRLPKYFGGTAVSLLFLFAQPLSREDFISVSAQCRCFIPQKKKEERVDDVYFIFISLPERREDIRKQNKLFCLVLLHKTKFKRLQRSFPRYFASGLCVHIWNSPQGVEATSGPKGG